MSSMIKVLVTGILLGLFSSCGDVVELTAEKREAADRYLTLLDRGRYAEVWNQSASIFQETVTVEDWISQVSRLKEPLGKAKTRRQRDAIGQQDPLNHPPGDYVLINFETGFENDDVLETLVLYKERGDWLLAGYFLK